jgi:hypothetical protein
VGKVLVRAYSKEEAILLAQRSYDCPADLIKVTSIKEPISMMWGLIKKKRKFQITIVAPPEKYSDKESSKSFKDGYVEIKDGILTVVDPIDDGRYPSIIVDDPNIDVYINGKNETGVLLVTEKDTIELKPKNLNPITKISVELSEDKMQAVLNIYKQEGKRFYVKDVKKDIQIKICSGFERIEPENVTLAECIKELIDAGVKLEFIDIDAIDRLINSPNSASAIVAKGKAPIEGVKAQIKYYFNHLDQHIDDSLDYLEEGIEDNIRPIVQTGDVLAIKLMPAMQGKDGLTVTGEIVKVQEIQDEFLNAGQGAIILDSGTKAVALTSGRPILKNGMISVIPLLVIPNDVNKDTGNIDFDGDVIIKGNIMDNMKVVARGTIKILGSVYNSEVISNENINILGNVIGGKIRAGVSIINYFGIIPQFEAIEKVIIKLLKYMIENKKKQYANVTNYNSF